MPVVAGTDDDQRRVRTRGRRGDTPGTPTHAHRLHSHPARTATATLCMDLPDVIDNPVTSSGDSTQCAVTAA